MDNWRTVSVRSTAILAMILVVLAACNGATPDDGGPGDDTSTTTTTSTTTSTTVPDTTTTTGDVPSGGGGDSCIVGVWSVDNEAFFAAMMAAAEDEGDLPDEFQFSYVGGDYLVEFVADGTMLTSQDEWAFAGQSEEGTFRLVFNGETTGTWETDGETLAITDTASNLELRAEMEVDGQVFTIPFPADDVDDPFIDTGTYRCSGDRLEVTFEGYTTTLDRR